MIIGIASQKQMGKDTLSNYLVDKLNERGGNWIRGAFAGNVKRIYCETFGVDMNFVEEWKVKDEIPPGFGTNVRKSLQFIGDGFRQIKSSIWIDLMFRDFSKDKIISDVRYPNEFIGIKREAKNHGTKGMNILMARIDMLNDDPNGSEALIKPYVQWALNTFPGLDFVDLSKIKDWSSCPPDAEQFDVFIRNDSSVSELYSNIDNNLIPFVLEYFKE